VEVGALDLHRAAAGGVEVADAGGEGREAVQRLAKGVQRQRLHVVFDVGVGWSALLRVKAPSCEGAMLMGPLRLSAYSSPILALPTSELAMVLSVGTFCTL
jgi:hypothetical protein